MKRNRINSYAHLSCQLYCLLNNYIMPGGLTLLFVFADITIISEYLLIMKYPPEGWRAI